MTPDPAGVARGLSPGESPVGASAEEVVLRLLLQLIVILVVTRLVSRLVSRLGQTAVSGEILAGLLLGPSLLGAPWLGKWAPAFMHALFHPSTATIFVGVAQVGLVLLMFRTAGAPAPSGWP